MKKITLFLSFICAIIICFTSCNDTACESRKHISFGGSNSLENLKEYIYDTENQSEFFPISPEAYVDFNSILPNSECTETEIMNPNEFACGYNDGIVILTIYNSNMALSSDLRKTEYMSCDFRDLEITKETDGYYIFGENEYTVSYLINSGRFVQIAFVIDEYYFAIHNLSEPTSSAQEAFVEAFMTESGTVEMIDRISALIPG